MMNDPVLRMLGLARRAGKLAFGDELVREACMGRVIVPDDQLSLAIGKEGQNARLAAKLTGCKIDIAPESQGE